MRREVLLVFLLLGASIPLALSAQGPLRALVTDRIVGNALPAPPTVAVTTPQDGEGVGRSVVLTGEARSDRGRIADVQVRVDGARWASVPDAARGERASVFRVPLDLAPGDHVLEVRASDGDAWSLPSRVLVRAGDVPPPTVRIVTPREGDGVPTGEVEVLGTVQGQGLLSVRVRVGAEEREARVLGASGASSLWTVTVNATDGVQRIVAQATGAGGASLERAVTVAAAPTPPPTLTVLRPDARASFGSAGSEECPTPCVLFAGVATGPDGVADVLAALDEGEPVPLAGEPAGLVADGPGAAWSWRLPVGELYSGPHVARFTPVAPDGTRGAPREVEFMLRTPRALLVQGDDSPRPTLTPLAFALDEAEGAGARWLLDGAPVAHGPRAEVVLPRPGDHVLVAVSPDAEGRARVARVPLYALNRAPVVSAIDAEPAVATRPVLLVARATDADGRVTRYAWDFGDGTAEVATAPEARHAFPREGAYVVRVVAHDDAGGASPAAVLTLDVANAAPIASFRWSPEHPTLLDDVRFEDASRDPEGRLVGWSWSFGDAASDERSPTHRFRARGANPVTLTVRDGDGAVSSRTAVVDVQNLPPVAAFRHAPLLPATGEDVLFTDASTKPDGAIVERRWDLAGVHATGATVRHAFHAPGRHAVTLTVVDDFGATSNVTLLVDVRDAAPLVERVLVEPREPNATQSVRFHAVALDAEGDIASVHWSFGDGANATGTEVEHAYARSGRYDVVVAALDAAGQRGVLNLTLTVRNALPSAALRLVDGGYAGHPTVLEADAADPDGRIASYAFDFDDDGYAECSGHLPRCVWTFARVESLVARVTVTDDEGGEATAALPLRILAPPGGVAAPTVTILTPLPDALLKGQVLLEGTAQGYANLTRVEAQLRDQAWSLVTAKGGWLPAEGANAWRLLLDTRAFPDGAYTLAVRAVDETGGANESLVPVRIGNGPRPSEVALRVLNLDPGATLERDLVVRGTAYHPDGVTSVRWRLDDGAWRTAQGLPLSWSVPLPVRDLEPGRHVLRVEAHRGLVDHSSVEVPFHVPDFRPTLVVDVPPNPTLYARVRIEGEASPAARAQWRVDSGLWRDAAAAGERWVVDASTDDLQGGPHVISVRAVDGRTGFQGESLQFYVRVLNPKAREAALQTAAPVESPRDAPLGLLVLLALPIAALAWGRRGPPPRRL